jgi:hypothetical protein
MRPMMVAGFVGFKSAGGRYSFRLLGWSQIQQITRTPQQAEAISTDPPIIIICFPFHFGPTSQPASQPATGSMASTTPPPSAPAAGSSRRLRTE